MVKNPGLIPSMKTLREGEIKRKRAMITQMLNGCWKSCIEPDPKTGAPFVAQHPHLTQRIHHEATAFGGRRALKMTPRTASTP